MSYLPVAKLGVQFVTGLGVSKILADIVKNNVSVVTTADAVKVWTGSFVLGSIIIEQTSNHIERVVNDVSEALEKRKAEKETEQ
jgi:uncharacterized protein YgfB (UPF0149 family)